MVSKKPRIPNRDYTLRYKGKVVKIVVASHFAEEEDLWGAQFLCPWGCGAKFIKTHKVSPKRVADRLQAEMERHYNIKHQSNNP